MSDTCQTELLTGGGNPWIGSCHREVGSRAYSNAPTRPTIGPLRGLVYWTEKKFRARPAGPSWRHTGPFFVNKNWVLDRAWEQKLLSDNVLHNEFSRGNWGGMGAPSERVA